jgi:HTH-type transcriptional regulator / antitoxin HipB
LLTLFEGNFFPLGKSSVEIRSDDAILSRTVKPMRQQVHKAEQLGNAIRAARRAQGLTLEQVALAAGTGVRFVSELERGKASAELGKTLRVMEVIGMQAWVDAEGLDAGA